MSTISTVLIEEIVKSGIDDDPGVFPEEVSGPFGTGARVEDWGFEGTVGTLTERDDVGGGEADGKLATCVGDVAVRATTGIKKSGGLISSGEQFFERLISEESRSGYPADFVPLATRKSIAASKSVVEVTHRTLPALLVTSNTSICRPNMVDSDAYGWRDTGKISARAT